MKRPNRGEIDSGDENATRPDGPDPQEAKTAPKEEAAEFAETIVNHRSGVDEMSGTGPPQTSVPGYSIEGVLGRGGMGVVYRARDLKLKRPVALKMILGAAHADAEQIDRFRTEAELVARLAHTNIVQIFEIGEHNNLPYVTFELVEGGDLTAAIRTLQPVRSVARIVHDVAVGTAAAHAEGIVHRDLKPSNILLAEPPEDVLRSGSLRGEQTRDSGGSASAPNETGRLQKAHSGRASRYQEPSTWLMSASDKVGVESLTGRVPIPKITDFGLARQQDAASDHTHTGDVLGTPSYMAPEQAESRHRDVGPRTDVYSLGAILYALLTGRPPFVAASVMQLLDQVRHQEALPPSRIVAGIPADLETICLKCLQKSPERRYQSAVELAAELDRFLAGEPILARPISSTERAVKWARRRPDELSRTISQWKQRGLIAENVIPDRGPLDFLVHDNVKSVVQAGYKFGISHDAVASLLIGTGNVEHLEENVETITGSPLPAADVTKIRTIFGDIVESEGDTG